MTSRRRGGGVGVLEGEGGGCQGWGGGEGGWIRGREVSESASRSCTIVYLMHACISSRMNTLKHEVSSGGSCLDATLIHFSHLRSPLAAFEYLRYTR